MMCFVRLMWVDEEVGVLCTEFEAQHEFVVDKDCVVV